MDGEHDTTHVEHEHPGEVVPIAVPNPEKKHLEVVREPTPIESLLTKLEGWLLQQPEFLIVLSAPRKVRRQASQAIAKRLLTYPTRGRRFGP